MQRWEKRKVREEKGGQGLVVMNERSDTLVSLKQHIVFWQKNNFFKHILCKLFKHRLYTWRSLANKDRQILRNNKRFLTFGNGYVCIDS